MNKEEMKDKLEDLKAQRFMLAMNDHWSTDDYEKDRELTKQIKELREQLEQ